MVSQLRRGIAHYQSGTEDTPAPSNTGFQARRQAANAAVSAPAAPAAPVPPETGFVDPMTGARFAPPLVATTPAAPSGAGQLFRGLGSALNPFSTPGDAGRLFSAAAQNPESSPVTGAVAEALNQQATMKRAADLVAPPSPFQYLVSLFAGNPASHAALGRQADTAAKLGDPLVQQHLINNPNDLARAERDPHGYAAQASDPEFRQIMAKAVDAHAAAANNPKVLPNERQRVGADMVKHGVTADQATAAMAPRRYTRDEFINTFANIPTDTFMQLFGAKLQHVPSSQEKAATEYIDRLHGEHLEATKKVNQMLEADAKAEAEKKPRIYGREPLWGQSELAKAQAERATKLQILLDALASHAGIAQKQIQVPPKG